MNIRETTCFIEYVQPFVDDVIKGVDIKIEGNNIVLVAREPIPIVDGIQRLIRKKYKKFQEEKAKLDALALNRFVTKLDDYFNVWNKSEDRNGSYIQIAFRICQHDTRKVMEYIINVNHIEHLIFFCLLRKSFDLNDISIQEKKKEINHNSPLKFSIVSSDNNLLKNLRNEYQNYRRKTWGLSVQLLCRHNYFGLLPETSNVRFKNKSKFTKIYILSDNLEITNGKARVIGEKKWLRVLFRCSSNGNYRIQGNDIHIDLHPEFVCTAYRIKRLYNLLHLVSIKMGH